MNLQVAYADVDPIVLTPNEGWIHDVRIGRARGADITARTWWCTPRRVHEVVVVACKEHVAAAGGGPGSGQV